MLCLWFLALLAQPAPAAEHAIFKSVDRGITWTKAASLAGSPRINSFGATGKRVFAGTDTGIYSTDDDGLTWRKSSVTARTTSFAVAGGTIFAGTQSVGLLASGDQGLTWNSITGLASRNVRSLLAGDGMVIAGTDADGVMVSTDQGRTWVERKAGLPEFSQVFALARMGGTIFAGLYAKGLYAWNETRWQWVKVGSVKPLVLAAAAGGGSLVAGQNPGGIYWMSQKPDGSGEWTEAIGAFPPPAPVWELAAGDGLVLAGVADGVFRSEDAGRTWVQARLGLPAGSPAVSFLLRGDTILAGLVMSPRGGRGRAASLVLRGREKGR